MDFLTAVVVAQAFGGLFFFAWRWESDRKAAARTLERERRKMARVLKAEREQALLDRAEALAREESLREQFTKLLNDHAAAVNVGRLAVEATAKKKGMVPLLAAAPPAPRPQGFHQNGNGAPPRMPETDQNLVFFPQE